MGPWYNVWNTSQGIGTRRSTSSLMSFPHHNYCSAPPLAKGRTSVLSAIPWINDSTTVQNEIFIA
jgi:hypothetical protein